MPDLVELLNDAAVGRLCEVTRHEHSWGFRFEGKCWVMVSCPWRIVTTEGIAFGSEDDGHQFGLPAPVNGEAKVREIMGSHPLTSLAMNSSTADLTLSFGNGSRVDVFNNSMGYEGWQAGVETEQGEATIIACGGGSTDLINPKGS